MGLFWTLLLNGLLWFGGLQAARGLGQPRGLTSWLAAAALSWSWLTLGMELLGSFGFLSRVPLLAWVGLGVMIGLVCRYVWPIQEESGPSVAAGPQDQRWGPCTTIAVGITLWTFALWGFRSAFNAVKVVSDGPIYHLWFASRWWQESRLSLVPTPFGDNVATYFPAVGDLWFCWLIIGSGTDALAKVGQAPFLILSGFASFAIARRLGGGFSGSVIAACCLVTASPLLVFAFEPNVDSIMLAGYLLATLFLLRYCLGDGGFGTLAIGAMVAGAAWGCKPTGLVFLPPLLFVVGIRILYKPMGRWTRLGHLAALALLPMLNVGYWYLRNLQIGGNPLYPLQVEIGGHVVLPGWFGREVMSTTRYYIDPKNWRAFLDVMLQVFDPRLAPLWVSGLMLSLFSGLGRSRSWQGNSGVEPSSSTPILIKRAVAVIAVLGLVNVILYWAGIPYRTQQRFVFPALGLASISLALLISRASVLRLLAVGLLSLHLFTGHGWPWAGPGEDSMIPWDLTPMVPNAMPAAIRIPVDWEAVLEGSVSGSESLSGLISPLAVGAGGIVAALCFGIAWNRRSRIRNWILAGGSFLGFLLIAGLLLFPWETPTALRFYPGFPNDPGVPPQARFGYTQGWLTLHRLARSDEPRVAYVGTNLPYYLLGPELKNRVRYININEHRDWLLHDYHREATAQGRPNWPGYRPEWDREEADLGAWLGNLRAEQIEWLVVARHNVDEPWPIERQWADEYPELFRLQDQNNPANPLFLIYRFEPEQINSRQFSLPSGL